MTHAKRAGAGDADPLLECVEKHLSDTATIIAKQDSAADRLAIVAAQVAAVHEQAHAVARIAIEHAGRWHTFSANGYGIADFRSLQKAIRSFAAPGKADDEERRR